jgi:hypothetical protein
MKGLMIGCSLVLALFSISEAAAQAGYYCSEPSPPYCIDGFGTFDDEWSFNRCRDEVESYVSEVTDFQNCLAQWHEAAGYEAENVIEKFNCKAQGNTFCP